MDRTNAPFVVLKPVLTAIASPTASPSLSSWGRRALMILVPQNKKCFASSGATDEADKLRSRKDSSVAGTLETGTDSPKRSQNLSLMRFVDLTSEHAFIDNAIASQ